MASAKLLASRGAKVVIGDRNEELGDSVYKEATEANHSITFRRVDVTDADDVRAPFKFAMSELVALMWSLIMPVMTMHPNRCMS